MKSDRHILTIQTLSILPLVLFLSIYMGSFYLILPLILLGVNFYRYIKGLNLIHYPILAILIATFFIYALYGLGSPTAPQTFETFDRNNKSVLFEFDKKQNIDKFCYYAGIDKNSKFDLEYLKDNRWISVYKHNDSFPYSFRWNCQKIKINSSKIKLTLHQKSLMIGEVRFIEGNQTIKAKTTHKLLNDESQISIDKSYFGGMYFDEIYHARTAYELLHDIPVYETTHPYLGKWIIAIGIKYFGMTPFGWRISNVIFGALFIFVAYYFTLMLLKEESLAFASAIMILYSFMHFTQARAGFIDTFGVLFVFISYYFLYRFILYQRVLWLIMSGLFFGLAGAIKWSALFASLGFLAIAIYLIVSKYPLKEQFKGYRLILYGVLSYILIAIAVYTLTFWDIYLKTGSFQSIIDYQINMYKYHTALVATHPYSSPWWSWILDLKPMCYYREIKESIFSSITCFGNPALFWIGVVAMLYTVYIAVRKRAIESIFLLFAFFSLYLPYIFVSRLMFIYHFYYAVPFLILMIAYLLKDILKWNFRGYIIYFLYLISIITLFLLFYPVLSGYEVIKSFVDTYLIWIDGWWL